MIDQAAAQLAFRNRLLTVAGLPTMVAWENKAFTPTVGTPYLTDQFVPATMTMISMPAQHGTIEETGFYIVQWFGLADTGVTAIRAGIGVILAAFTPGTTITSATGDVLRVRGDAGPQAGQLIPLDSGFTACIAKIGWRARTQNTIAA